jgi:serine/threonine protein kinase
VSAPGPPLSPLPTTPQLAPGLQVTPTLRLVREIGRGSMGRVWVAEHASLQAEVAVKLITERAALIPEATERFCAEASAIARIRNPHVVQVLDHGVAGELPYIVMELLDGEDLASYLRRERRLRREDTIALLRQTAKALEKAHSMGIVHRDIKPANLFLVAGMGEIFVKVLDFGLAKHPEGRLETATHSSAIFGTPHYMSPEQAERAREATPQSDLWSLAVVAYECLTGKRPFDADSLMGLHVALHELRFAPPSSLSPDLGPAVDRCFTRAFQHNPARRFRGTTEFATELGLALGSLSSSGSHATSWSNTGSTAPRLARPASLVPRVALAVGGIAIAVLAYATTRPRATTIAAPSARTASPPPSLAAPARTASEPTPLPPQPTPPLPEPPRTPQNAPASPAASAAPISDPAGAVSPFPPPRASSAAPRPRPAAAPPPTAAARSSASPPAPASSRSGLFDDPE